jgi:Domain of Unknown Function with PDB structure (DUF3857)/Transglutaminase-like superfamily
MLRLKPRRGGFFLTFPSEDHRMKALRYLILVSCLSFAGAAHGQKEDWLPVTPEDLQIKEVPGNPGAAAVQLYYANYIDDYDDYEFEYHRIKILNPSGLKYADVEITGGTDVDISSLKARTIHPDGSIVEFTGKPFNRTVFKTRGVKVNSKTFTLPDVTVGSIVEYKFKKQNYSSDFWILQHELYTVREYFSFQPRHSGGNIGWSGRNLRDPLPARKSAGWELEWRNVPPFKSEEQMPPAETYKPAVNFYYTPSYIKNDDKFWEELGRIFYDYFDRYIGKRHEVRDAALEAIGSETDPEKKLRKLYARAQQIRNLSYERSRTKEEKKKEKLKENENLGDIVKRGYGDSEDITAFFVGMARAAGFDAQVLLVSNRKRELFSPKLVGLSSLGGRVALVKLNGRDVYLQPGVRFCPYGLLRWANTSTDALRPEKQGGSFILVPPLDHKSSLTRRLVKAELVEDGSLKGEITVEFNGQEALEHRLDALDSDDAGKKQDLETELQSSLPAGASVQLTSVQGWEAPDDSLVAKFTVTVPAFASFAGKRTLLPLFLFQPHQKDAFKHAERVYPVYFPYAFTERDRIEVKLPAGFAVESIPPKQTEQISYASYQRASVSDGKLLVAERVLGLNAIFVPVAQYPELKDFMGKVQAGDEQQVVLRNEVKSVSQTN